MLFNSYIFIFIFLPIVFFAYFGLNSYKKTSLSKLLLVGASLFFYAFWNIAYLPLLLGSILVNYYISKAILHYKSKWFLASGVVFNLGLLGYFKYTDFFIQNINFTFNTHILEPQIILPLAISFFTFQQIAYLVDSSSGGGGKQYSLLDYTLFVSFFPQLIAGPIVHHKEMMPQFARLKTKLINYKNISLGLFIFSIGLFKKIVIADSFAVYVNSGFSSHSLSLLEAWVTSLSYTFQLYFDFSGYTDMAIGLGLLFNIRLPSNFNSPYKALNIQDFWQSWHMTLSRFLKDYIYIPLGGNKRGKTRTYFNLFIVFLLGGLWHGASWTFVIWGALHGIAIVTHRVYRHFGFKMNKLLAWFLTFNFVNIAWVFFKSPDLSTAFMVLGGMVGGDSVASFLHGMYFVAIFPMLFFAFFITIFMQNSNFKLINFTPKNFNLILIVFCFLTSLFLLGSKSEFLYFNF